MIEVEENQVHVDTCTLKATFEAGVLVFLMRKGDGRVFAQAASLEQPNDAVREILAIATD